MEWQRVTALVIVSAVTVLVLYDLVAYTFGGNEATISRLCLNVKRANPGWELLFTFAFGVLVGHLFLSQTTPPPK